MSPETGRVLAFAGLLVWAGFWVFVAGHYKDEAEKARRKLRRLRQSR